MTGGVISIEKFAKMLGFKNANTLLKFSDITHEQCNTSWLITELKDGRCVAWRAEGMLIKINETWVITDEIKVPLDSIAYFDNPEDAEAYNEES